jgi:hypothetical protein
MTNLSYGPFISREQAKTQGIKWYFTGIPCKHGHIDVRQLVNQCCRTCGNKRLREAYAKNPQKDIDRVRRYQIANPEGTSLRRKKSADKLRHTEAYKEGQRRSTAKWLAKNPRATAWENMTPHRKLTIVLRTRFKRTVVDGTGAAARGMIGCSVDACRKHIEQQFLTGMDWDNYGTWHIDHIRPCASFDLTDPEQQKQCFHYTNLQPLWAAENLAKSDKWEPVAT